LEKHPKNGIRIALNSRSLRPFHVKPVSSFERYASRRLYYDFDFLPKTKDIVYSANTSGQFNLWRQTPPTKKGPGPARQLTGFMEWSVRHIAPSPNGKTVLVFADKDGDENYQIFSVDADAGWQTPLVSKPGVRHEFGQECVSPNGKFAAYGSNERNRKDMDVMVAEMPGGEERRVLADGGVYSFGTWSRDGQKAIVTDVVGTDDFNLYLVNMKSGEKKLLTPHNEKAVYFPGPWSLKGDGFYLLSNEGWEYAGLGYMSLKDLKIKWLETPDCEIVDLALSRNGRVLAWVENRESYNHITLKDLKTGRKISGLKTGGAVFPGWFDNNKLIKFSQDGRQLVCLFSAPTKPSEVYVLNLPKLGMVPYTNGYVGNVPSKEMIEPQLVRYDSFDRKVPAFLYKPKIGPGQRAPALVVVHGGPESQERPWYAYAGLYQYLLSRGIGILALNIRGSIGYGKSYQKLIHHDWGGGELQDIDHAAKYLKTLDWVDPERLAIFGGSFGGFATLSASTRLPEHWRVAVDIFGPSNLVTFAKAVPEHWKRFMAEWVGDPEKEADFLASRSPMTYIDQLKCPILVIQGANDPRVVKPESDQLVEKLKSRGVKVDYVIFPDEGHGFTKQKNEHAAYKHISEFLTEHLLQ
jgi:Tol biopolymer transport system component/dienelactone hydrolase